MTTLDDASASRAPRPPDRRLVGVDLLRAVSILLVLAVHWPRHDVPLALLPHIDRLLLEAAARGGYGVTLFFGISGFLITRTIMLRETDIHRMSLSDFYLRRVARIWPLLFACIAIGAAALALGSSDSVFRASNALPFNVVFWVSLFTFTFNWVRVLYGGLHGGWGLHWDIMWSLAVEEQFYLLLPLALVWSRTTARFVTVLLPLIGICALSRYVMSLLWQAQWEFTSNACFDALAMGVLAALYAPRFDRRLAPGFLIGGAILILVGGLSLDPAEAPLVLVAGACAFMLGAQARDDIFGRAWALPARIGALSYEMYLLHPIVYACIAPYVTPDLGGYGLTYGWLVFVAITVIVAEIVHNLFTEPANRWLRRHLRGRPAISASASSG